MDPLYMANSLFRRRKFEECVEACTEILEANPLDQVSCGRSVCSSSHSPSSLLPPSLPLSARLRGF